MPGILPNYGQSTHILIDTHIFPSSLEGIHVVRNFPDVFPNELPGSLANWELNKFNIKNEYPFLRVDDLFYQLQGTQVFFKNLDQKYILILKENLEMDL